MNRRPVQSSNISSIGWSDDTLEVAFTSGHLYAYEGVPESVYQEALGAGSVGKYVATHIVGKYQSQRLS